MKNVKQILLVMSKELENVMRVIARMVTLMIAHFNVYLVQLKLKQDAKIVNYSKILFTALLAVKIIINYYK